MNARELHDSARPDPAGAALVERAMAKLGLSARAYTRILKVARTVADLAGAEQIGAAHVAEAIQYRALDRERRA
jgi:magnesium chelatase family protein